LLDEFPFNLEVGGWLFFVLFPPIICSIWLSLSFSTMRILGHFVSPPKTWKKCKCVPILCICRQGKKKGGPFTPLPKLLIGCMEIVFLNIGYHYIWPGLIALPKNTILLGYLFHFILIS
jgi:hypothetical protein